LVQGTMQCTDPNNYNRVKLKAKGSDLEEKLQLQFHPSRYERPVQSFRQEIAIQPEETY